MAGAPPSQTPLGAEWKQITDIYANSQFDASMRVLGPGIGYGITPGDKFEFTGISGQSVFEGLQFIPYRMSDDEIVIDFNDVAETRPDFVFKSSGGELWLSSLTSSYIDSARQQAQTDGVIPAEQAASFAGTQFTALVSAVNAGGGYATEESAATSAINDMIIEMAAASQLAQDYADSANTEYLNYLDFIKTAQPGGMVRVYPGGSKCSLIVSFNPHDITAITSTGDSGAEVAVDNVLNSNRGMIHTLPGGSDHDIVPSVKAGALINSVALVDYAATKADGTTDKDILIRMRGGGAYPVDVVYPATVARYTLDGRPAVGYPGVNIDGHNDADPIRHFIAYIPPIVADGTEQITILNSAAGTTIKFSELMLSSYWSPDNSNFNFGSKTVGTIIANDTRRGDVIHRNRLGLELSRSLTISMMSEADCTYIDLMIKSGRTMIFDSYPDGTEKRWRTMIVGYLSGDVSTEQLRAGATVEIPIIDSKLHAEI